MDFGTRSRLFEDDEEEEELNYDADGLANKEHVVYLIDAGCDMMMPFEKGDSYLKVVMKAVEEDLKGRILARDDKVGICFFNTLKKKNIQEADGVYVWSELDDLTAELIRNFRSLHENFQKDVGSQMAIAANAQQIPLYDAIWVVTAMLRSGGKNVAKIVRLITNNDDPFSEVNDSFSEKEWKRLIIQKAQDAADLGITLDLLPLNTPDKSFDVNVFYDQIMHETDVDSFENADPASMLEQLQSTMKKRMYKKRVVRKMLLTVASGTEIALRTYAMIRPSVPPSHIFVDSLTNQPLKVERTFICGDTGSLMNEPLKRFEEYQGKKVVLSVDEVSEIKKISDVQLRLLGFKSLACLQPYHNLRPPTFIYPDEEAVKGSTCAFIALHRAMVRLKKYAVAFLSGRATSQLVALVAQEESDNQESPNGMNMIHLPYSNDIRPAEKYHASTSSVPRASSEQIVMATDMIKKLHLKNYSVTDYPDPALQKQYSTLQTVALEQDEENLPTTEDFTLPDTKLAERAEFFVKIFKNGVFGENHEEEEREAAAAKERGSAATQKRKAAADLAATESQEYNWAQLADTGKLKDLTTEQLKIYLRANKLPLAGKKDILINRILTHLGK
ncbi:hypothetical protein M758_8G019900 [Ceratodon purpureus]|nr:hypothetical protein M758_8G019900 [Ceratodon purpureus]